MLNELENNQDIELKTAPEYVVGYLVEKLRNKDLFKEQERAINKNNQLNRQLRKEV